MASLRHAPPAPADLLSVLQSLDEVVDSLVILTGLDPARAVSPGALRNPDSLAPFVAYSQPSATGFGAARS